MILEISQSANEDGKIIHQDTDLFQTESVIGERNIIFKASREKNLWRIVFYERGDNDKEIYKKTNSGNPFLVFTFIMHELKRFIGLYDPRELTFTAWNDDDHKTARANIYFLSIKKYLGSGFLIRKETFDKFSKFTLTKKIITEIKLQHVDASTDPIIEPNYYEARLNLNNDTTVVFCAVEDTDRLFDVAFYTEMANGHVSFDETGLGNQFKIFAFIHTQLQKFVKALTPKTMKFSASLTAGKARSQIYEKYIFSNLPEYTVSKEYTDKAFVYTLERG